MLGSSTMTAPKKSTAKKPSTKASARGSKLPDIEPTRADGRAKSLLAMERERGALEAGRALLLKVLRDNDWNLSATARTLGMPGASSIIRAIRDHGLDSDYEAARSSGKITHASRG